MNVCVLISGGGSNLQALIDARDDELIGIDIVGVISNQADAMGLVRAKKAGIPVSILENGHFADGNSFDRALALLIGASRPHLVILAGFMRIIGSAVLESFSSCMVNLHPSLLPLYPGLDTYQRALDAGDNEHGASIHFVSPKLDGGPVISQVRIPVLPGDDKHKLARRLAPMEHRLLVSTVEFFTQHNVENRLGEVFVDGCTLHQPLQLKVDTSRKL